MQALKLLENRQHGHAGFPVALYHVDSRHPRYVMPLHWHDEGEIILVRSGRLDYQVDSQRGGATAGDLLFVNSGLLHSGMPQNCVYDCLVFDYGLLMRGDGVSRPLLAPYAEGSRQVWLRLPGDDRALGQVAAGACDAFAGARPGHELVVRGLLCQFFGLVLERGYTRPAAEEKAGGQKHLRQLKAALTLIEDGYTQPLTLEQLARAAGMSPKYFCQSFKELTRRTPMDYLNHHRIEAARTLLAQGAPSVTEVAYECGFNDLSYFIRVFKRYVGVTPKRYGKALVPGGQA